MKKNSVFFITSAAVLVLSVILVGISATFAIGCIAWLRA